MTDPMQRARELLASGLDDIAAANIRKHGDDARLSVAVPHALGVIEQLVEAIDEASEALDRMTTVSAHMLNHSDAVRQMAASSGGFWAQRAINAERQRDEALTREEEVRGEALEEAARIAMWYVRPRRLEGVRYSEPNSPRAIEEDLALEIAAAIRGRAAGGGDNG